MAVSGARDIERTADSPAAKRGTKESVDTAIVGSVQRESQIDQSITAPGKDAGKPFLGAPSEAQAATKADKRPSLTSRAEEDRVVAVQRQSQEAREFDGVGGKRQTESEQVPVHFDWASKSEVVVR